VKAGADGRFSVEDLPREERFTLVAVSEGLLPGRMPALWIERRGLLDLGDLVLGPAQRLEVQVRDRGSHLVGGASVSVVRSPFFTQTMDWVSRQLRAPALPSPEASGRTDPRGTAVFESIPPGNWTVLVEAEGYARSASWAYVQEGEAREPVRVLLLPACELSGTVFGADGKALPSVAVQATPVDGSWPQEYGRVESTTDPAGAYRLPGLREGPVNLTVQLRPDLQQSAGTVQLPSVRRFDIHLGPGFSVKGKVLDDATKEPVAGASVTLQIWPPQGGPGQASARRESGADGSFLFESLPPGTSGTSRSGWRATWTGRTPSPLPPATWPSPRDRWRSRM